MIKRTYISQKGRKTYDYNNNPTTVIGGGTTIVQGGGGIGMDIVNSAITSAITAETARTESTYWKKVEKVNSAITADNALKLGGINASSYSRTNHQHYYIGYFDDEDYGANVDSQYWNDEDDQYAYVGIYSHSPSGGIISLTSDNIQLNGSVFCDHIIKSSGDVISYNTVSAIPRELTVIDNLNSDSPTNALSAKQGKVLKEYIDTHSGGTATSIPWSGITNKPTTIAGYGITNAYTKTQIDTTLDNYYTSAQTDNKISQANAFGKTSTGNSIYVIDTQQSVVGTRTMAVGYKNKISGDTSFVEGIGNSVSGNTVHCEGSGNTVTNHFSHCEGSGNTLTGMYEHCEGVGNILSGVATHCEGNISGYSVTLTSISGSTSAFTYTAATGQYLCKGMVHKISGKAISAVTVTSGGWDKTGTTKGTVIFNGSISATTLSAITQSLIMGGTFGDYSHKEGTGNISYGTGSHTEGRRVTAYGNYSHGEGIGIITNNEAEHAQGKYNVSDSSTIHSIGFGTNETNRKNAVQILSNGNAYVYGIGGFNGKNRAGSTSLQDVIKYHEHTQVGCFEGEGEAGIYCRYWDEEEGEMPNPLVKINSFGDGSGIVEINAAEKMQVNTKIECTQDIIAYGSYNGNIQDLSAVITSLTNRITALENRLAELEG